MPSDPAATQAEAATWARLQTFLQVVDAGSVRAAAEARHVTPPAVSAAVTALERELGVQLFAKSGRGITPTPAGLRFADYARTMIGLLEEAASAVRESEHARLRIGAVATASEFVLPPLLASFARARPGVELSLSVLPRDDLFAQLRHHEVDVVLAGRPPRASGLVSWARRDNRLVVVGTPQVADAIGSPREATWLLRGAGSGTLQATRSVLDRIGAPARALTLGTHGAVVAAAREGLGLTLVHEDAVAGDLAAGRLVAVPVPGTPLDRPWHLVTTPRAPQVVTTWVRHVCDPSAVGPSAFTASRTAR
jgi:LysR family transcriptional regulator, low CO2-responsive transcriptional regulator